MRRRPPGFYDFRARETERRRAKEKKTSRWRNICQRTSLTTFFWLLMLRLQVLDTDSACYFVNKFANENSLSPSSFSRLDSKTSFTALRSCPRKVFWLTWHNSRSAKRCLFVQTRNCLANIRKSLNSLIFVQIVSSEVTKSRDYSSTKTWVTCGFFGSIKR